MTVALPRMDDSVFDPAYDPFSVRPTPKRIYDWLRHCWRVVDARDVGRAPKPGRAGDPDALIRRGHSRSDIVGKREAGVIDLVDRHLAAISPDAIPLATLASEIDVPIKTLREIIRRRPEWYEATVITIRQGNLPSKRMMVRLK